MDGIQVLADPLLYKVFHNLIDNSLRHGGSVRRMGVHVERSGENILIVHTDDGQGIGEEEKRMLFREGHGKDHGLGLFLSREILDITVCPSGRTVSPVRALGSRSWSPAVRTGPPEDHRSRTLRERVSPSVPSDNPKDGQEGT